MLSAIFSHLMIKFLPSYVLVFAINLSVVVAMLLIMANFKVTGKRVKRG